MTLMNVQVELVVKELSASIHQAVTIANVNQDLLEIHFLFVHLCKRMLATIPSDANAMQIRCVHLAIVVKKESAKIYVKRFLAVQEQVVILEDVCVLLDILDHPMTQPKAVTFMISVKSIKTASHLKSVSKLDEVYENVLMVAVDSNVVRMLCVLPKSTVRPVFVVMVITEIQVTLKMVARDNEQSILKVANRTVTARTDTYARLMLLVKEHASIHVKMLLVVQMNIVNWTKIAIQYVSAKKVSCGIPYHLDAKNHPFRIV